MKYIDMTAAHRCYALMTAGNKSVVLLLPADSYLTIIQDATQSEKLVIFQVNKEIQLP